MPSIIPSSMAGAIVVRDAAGNVIPSTGVENAYIPPSSFETSCDLAYLPSDCTARIYPTQINAFQSEMFALAVAFNSDGSWNCNNLTNMADAFNAWVAETLPGIIEEEAAFDICDAPAAETIPGGASFLMCSPAGAVRVPTAAMPYITGTQLEEELEDYVPRSIVGQPGGVVPLEADGLISADFLPSYVDDVMEFENEAAFPNPGEADKIYVSRSSNLTYRWSGTQYVRVGGGDRFDFRAKAALTGNVAADATRTIIYNSEDYDDKNVHNNTTGLFTIPAGVDALVEAQVYVANGQLGSGVVELMIQTSANVVVARTVASLINSAPLTLKVSSLIRGGTTSYKIVYKSHGAQTTLGGAATDNFITAFGM